MNAEMIKTDPFAKMRKRVEARDKDGNLKHEFPSARQAAKAIGVTYSTISKRCNEERTDKDGYKWAYVE